MLSKEINPRNCNGSTPLGRTRWIYSRTLYRGFWLRAKNLMASRSSRSLPGYWMDLRALHVRRYPPIT